MTSPAFIFGTSDLGSASRDPALQGMDIGRLRLEAEFSYSKRINKIQMTFERTAKLLGVRFAAIARGYASEYPPRTYQRYPDAKSFYDYFVEKWAYEPSTTAWAVDVAAIELALARARTLRPTAMETEALATCPKQLGSLWYRVHPCAVLVRCGHDVRACFDLAQSEETVEPRPVCMIVLAARGRRRPLVMEIEPESFAFLQHASEWTALESQSVPNDPRMTVAAMVRQLVEAGLVLVCPNDARLWKQE